MKNRITERIGSAIIACLPPSRASQRRSSFGGAFAATGGKVAPSLPHTFVRDSVRGNGSRGRSARAFPAGGPGPLAARAGTALERLRADAVAGGARHHLAHAGGGGEDRRRPRPHAVPAPAPRRGAAVRDRPR